MSPITNGVPKHVRNDFTAWVLHASLVGFTAGCLIYDMTVQDDPLVRQLILADVLKP